MACDDVWDEAADDLGYSQGRAARNWDRKRQLLTKVGVVDFEDSPETEEALQAGFDAGFKAGLHAGLRWGALQGDTVCLLLDATAKPAPSAAEGECVAELNALLAGLWALSPADLRERTLGMGLLGETEGEVKGGEGEEEGSELPEQGCSGGPCTQDGDRRQGAGGCCRSQGKKPTLADTEQRLVRLRERLALAAAPVLPK